MGRGSSKVGRSGGTFDIRDNKGNKIGRLFSKNGKTFLDRGDGIPNELPTTKSFKDYLANVTKAGGSASKVTAKQMKSESEKRAKDRKEADRILNFQGLRDRHFVKGSRMNRIADRVAKRRR